MIRLNRQEMAELVGYIYMDALHNSSLIDPNFFLRQDWRNKDEFTKAFKAAVNAACERERLRDETREANGRR
jgi:hypothetical protein